MLSDGQEIQWCCNNGITIILIKVEMILTSLWWAMNFYHERFQTPQLWYYKNGNHDNFNLSLVNEEDNDVVIMVLRLS